MDPLQLPFAGHLQQRPGAVDIGTYHGVWLKDRAIHVSLGGKIDDGVNGMLVHGSAYRINVANIAAHKDQVRVIFGPFQVLHPTGVGELVVDHNAVGGVLLQHVVDEVRADESGSAGDKEVLHVSSHQ